MTKFMQDGRAEHQNIIKRLLGREPVSEMLSKETVSRLYQMERQSALEPDEAKWLADLIDETELIFALNYRVLDGLNCNAAFAPSQLAREMIALLRSPLDIEPEVREAIASALERGLDGSRLEERNADGRLKPYIELGGMGRDGRINDAISIRRKWFDAAEHLEKIRKAGKRGYDAQVEAGARFGLGVDGMKKATTFRNKFLKEVSAPGNSLVAQILNQSGSNTFDLDDDDDYFQARALFIERESEEFCKK